MADPRDFKFFPTDERLVKHYLRERIDTGRENFIKDIKLYEDEPWLLPHVNNYLFNTYEWFYFVKRTCKSGNTPTRTVLGLGCSNGGTWTTNGTKKVILDCNKVVIGYKTELAYYKKVQGKTKGDNTGWLMTEYWLASENDELFQEIVLCYIRGKKKKVNNVSSDSRINRVSQPLENIFTMVDPCDLKFFPTELKLVDHYLRNRVNTGKDGFITDIKLYEDEPWLLSHINNDQFIEKKWFYFVKRTHGSGKRPKRTVPGRGGKEGGTWTTTGQKTEIVDSNNIVIGYKVELSYYKHVKEKKKGDTTGWCMTEYWLAGENDDLFQEVVLCNIRVKKNHIDPVQYQIENNNIIEQTPVDNNMVLNALVNGVGEFGQQNMENDEVPDFTYQQQTMMLPHDPVQYQTENNNIIEQTPIDNNMVLNALVNGVGEFGQQNMENDEVPDFTYQQQTMMLPHESIPYHQGHDSRSTMDQYMDEYAYELENILDVEEGDDVRGIQQQHPQPPLQGQDLRSTMDQHTEAADEHVIMLDEVKEDGDDKATQQQHPQIPLSSQCQDSGNPLMTKDILANLDEFYFAGLDNMQRKFYSEENYLASDQEMSIGNNMMMTNNTHGCVFDTIGDEMQEPHVTNGVDEESSCSDATEEQSSKRRKQC